MELSVILPFHKDDFFQESLRSTRLSLEQIHSEILIINTTLANLDLGAHANSPQLVVIDAPGASYEEAIKLGVQLSQGRFIGLMNDDDLCSQDRFRIQLRLLNDSNGDIVLGGIKKFGGRKFNFNLEPDYSNYSPEMLLLGAYGANAACTFRKSWLIKRIHAKKYSIWDWQFALDNYFDARIIGTNKVVYLYRQHSKQITKSIDFNRLVLNSLPIQWSKSELNNSKIKLDNKVIILIILPKYKESRFKPNLNRKELALKMYDRKQLIKWIIWYNRKYVRSNYNLRNRLWFYYHSIIRILLF